RRARWGRGARRGGDGRQSPAGGRPPAEPADQVVRRPAKLVRRPGETTDPTRTAGWGRVVAVQPDGYCRK
ncbi:MAG: hypothetical protein ACJ73E_06830, partial [Mycobacteriales bacterium]